MGRVSTNYRPYDCGLHEEDFHEGVCASCEGERIALESMEETMNTPTPETDAAEAMVEQANFENIGKGQERSRKEAAWEFARSLETRLAAAEAELAALRSGEAALTPKIWTAETIKEAPEGQYVMMDNDWQRWGHWTTLTVDSARKGLNGVSGRYPCAYGPLPTPPMKEGE